MAGLPSMLLGRAISLSVIWVQGCEAREGEGLVIFISDVNWRTHLIGSKIREITQR